MLDRAEQRGIGPAEAGQHARVLLVALGLALRDGADLAGVGHVDLVAERREQPAHPRRVRARLHHDGGSGIALREGGQAGAVVDDHLLGDDVARGREDARGVLAVPEVDPDGDVIGSHKT